MFYKCYTSVIADCLFLDLVTSITNISCLLCNIVLLYSISKLTKLSELYFRDSNFSDGLPSVIGEITTLKTLSLDWCKLVDLPMRCVHPLYLY